MTNCIFCKIIKGEVPATKIYEDNDVYAFLDINPVNKGHSLVIPKKHYETIMDIPEELLEKVIVVVKKVSKALFKISEGITLGENNKSVAGQVVPHLHFHVIPRFKNDGFSFNWTNKKYKNQEAQELANKIKNLL